MSERWTARYSARDGGWTAQVVMRGEDMVAFGRSLRTARQRIVERLAEHLGTYGGAISLDDDVELCAAASEALAEARKARTAALDAAARASAATARAARELDEEELSLRDIAYLLGLSHSRVQQVLA